jgi:hypothetical protein
MTEEAVQYQIETIIQTVRGQKVILDADLARLYGVETRNLNRSAKQKNEAISALRSEIGKY